MLFRSLAAACDEPGAGTAAAPGADATTLAAPAPTRLGDALGSAPLVAVAELFKDPAAWEGKRVKVTGTIPDFCHHQGTWFGVASADGKQILRVFARPKFAAPKDSLGKRVTAAGKVGVITLDPQHAAHYAKEHKFVSAEEVAAGAPIRQPVLRAHGAEFQ